MISDILSEAEFKLRLCEWLLENDRIWNESYEVESGVRAFIHFQEKHLLPDAFVCANENIAVGLCHQAQQEGFKIPTDFCVTGFDNFDKASYYRPRITTVSGGEIIERFHG